MEVHTTVLEAEAVRGLAPRPDGRYADVTCGLGGHSEALLEASAPGGLVLSIDRDPEALEHAARRLERFGPRSRRVEGSFSDLARWCDTLSLTPLDGILADLGVSSLQLDDPGRGFSFRAAGPLDMRMGPSVERTAEALLNELDVESLADILARFGEVKRPRSLAQAILRARDEGGLATTEDLARVVERASRPRRGPKGAGIHPATLAFQALRIAVNRELEQLHALLDAAEQVLGPGGRLAVISFHSLEDRMVKSRFRGPELDPALRHLPVSQSPGPWRAVGGLVTPSEAEISSNPRARSAKLRIGEIRGGEEPEGDR
ncbi:MAG: 16S rRNA (cytosine(1402)-N(4))-methyltransferase RsmH [Myxococcota bacterium]